MNEDFKNGSLDAIEGGMKTVGEIEKEDSSAALIEKEKESGGSENIDEGKIVEKENKELDEIRERIDNSGNEQKEKNALEDIPEEVEQEEILKEVLYKTSSFKKKVEDLKNLKKTGYEFEIKGVTNVLLQFVADYKPFQKTRDTFANNMTEAIEESGYAEEFFNELEGAVVVGGGFNNNFEAIRREFFVKLNKEIEVISIDPYARPPKAMENNYLHLGQRFEDVRLQEDLDGGILVEASNYLQLYKNEEDKIELIKKMIRIAGIKGKLLITDEEKRPGMDGIEDRARNKLYNPFQKTYARLDQGRYEEIFRALGLEIVFTKQYDRGTIIFMLKVTREAMDNSMGKTKEGSGVEL